jgi:hypothetical protein
MFIKKISEHEIMLTEIDFNGDNFELLSNLQDKKWYKHDLIIKASNDNVKYVVRHFPDATWEDNAIEIKNKFIEEKVPSINSSYVPKRDMLPHQSEGFLLTRDEAFFALFLRQGEGKTKLTLDTAAYLYQQGRIDMLVVIAWPNGLHRNWNKTEIPLDLPNFCNHKDAYWSSNLSKKRLELLEEVMTHKDGLKILTFNVEACVSKKGKEYLLRCVKENRCLLVVDQSASIKNYSTKRTKFIIDKLAPLAPYRRILDGSPVAEGAEESYSQFKFLDWKIIGHKTWTAFRAEYCVVGYFNEIKSYKNVDKLYKLINPYIFRLKKDVLGLQPIIYKRWWFDLTSKEQRIYNELKKLDITTFSNDLKKPIEYNEILEAHLAIVKSMRLQQIASGWWPHAENFKSIEEEPSRLQALVNLLLHTNMGKVIIFGRFRADLELIQKYFGDIAVSYHGGIGEEERDIAKQKFMECPNTRFLIGQPRTLGVGHTLTSANNIIFYNNDYSLRFREECEKRAHRLGLKHQLTVWDLVADNTQDDKILTALRNKKEVSTEILKDYKSFFLC